MKEYNIKANISSGVVRFVYCPSHDKFSDVITKCLPEDTHFRHTLVLLGLAPTTGSILTHLNKDSTSPGLRLLDVSTSEHKQGESEDVIG